MPRITVQVGLTFGQAGLGLLVHGSFRRPSAGDRSLLELIDGETIPAVTTSGERVEFTIRRTGVGT